MSEFFYMVIVAEVEESPGTIDNLIPTFRLRM